MSGAGRILVVDDTAFNRRLLVRLLASIGHGAIEASDGAKALAMLRDPGAQPVDVVLLDIVMPIMDGYETLAALKADERLRNLPVIVISGVDELASVVRCIRMGAADYLPKTVDPEILRARIEASLAQKRFHDLERETLEQQVAVNDVLRIMSQSAFELQVVLDTLVAAATRVCRADYGVAYLAEEKVYRVAASAGDNEALDTYEREHPIPIGRESLVGRVAMTGQPSHIHDVLADTDYLATHGREVGGYRTLLGIPIRRDGEVAGVLALTRNEVRPFDDSAIRQATAFADQAAIGIHNARLMATIDRQRSQLARFLSPQVATLVSSHDGEAMLAGHRREITATFTDLRNFTSFSESARPEEVLGFLRDYHAAMGEIVVQHEGTLEHFAGDGLMVFFNDPIIQPDHAARAVRMAVAMRDRFRDLSEAWRERGYVLEIGVGIATGFATLGRIGFEGRYDYGAIGMAIILASRLSGEAAPGEILIAPRTQSAAASDILSEPAGERHLKGFSRPILAHMVTGLPGRAPSAPGVPEPESSEATA